MIPLFFQCQEAVVRMFSGKRMFLNFANFTGKHLCSVSFLIKLQPDACNTIEKETLAQVFSCEIFEISKNNFFTEHLRTTASDCLKIKYLITYKLNLIKTDLLCQMFSFHQTINVCQLLMLCKLQTFVANCMGGYSSIERIRRLIQILAQAVARRCSVKKVFLEISQNLQENICARDSFLIKLQTSGF